MTAPGWYLDPDDEKLERYWNGQNWLPADRPRGGDATAMSDSPAPLVTATNSPADGLRTASGWIYALAVLTALGAAIAGVLLMAHSVPNCFPNPYNDSFGTDLTECQGSTHPFVGAGAGILVGGLIQAAVLGVVGRLCVVVHAQHLALVALTTP